MNNEVEELRKELMNESARIRGKAKSQGICPNCSSLLPKGKRVWCSDGCALAFMAKYDYSKGSPILRAKKKEINEKKPKKEISPWSEPVARKEHKCWFCGLEIPKGEKYVKYTCLPGEEWFDESPYEVTSYHDQCMDFMTECVEVESSCML